jgi:apolipoprotein N-acyltransferase
MDQLEPGKSITRFSLAYKDADGRAQSVRIATPICYEGVFDRVCRAMVMQDGRKQVDVLANLSNDGWFVRGRQGTTEQPQHLSQYVFRAIESRVPVVRAVNTGISASIDSQGRILADVRQYDMRVMAAGTLILDGKLGSDGQYLPAHGPRVLVDSRVSVYSQVGDVFAQVVSLGAIVLVGWMLWKRKASPKEVSRE